ncbi:MAG: D-glycero-alpha-D-manno-heptose-7-phosphate kinase [Parcubacteria group bacterium Gr01-1014_70]|nr:MAG: D-glycero-alpha-D-manno-heptose-7-phosphate kinase [Parcubacteria group bacterium Gr01-1014_70]
MVITRTPFRISFFGGGTDYPGWYKEHGGAVLSTSINKYCYIICRELPPFFDCKYRIRYSQHEEVLTVAEIKHPSVRACLTHVSVPYGIEMQHNADVPGMSGLGSSSAFTVGLLRALHALMDRDITKYQLARDAIHVEQHIIQENVGSQDQTAAAFGGFNKIEFGGPEEIRVTPLPIDGDRLRELQQHLVLVFTRFGRNASEIAGEQIRTLDKKYAELNHMRQLVNEAYAVFTTPTRSLDEIGILLHETWLLKRSLTSKITTPFIDDAYEAARQGGALGGKLLGAGGGGFMLFYVRPEARPRVLEKLKGLLHVPFAFESFGSHVIYNMNSDIHLT